jgi:hypothetical protein
VFRDRAARPVPVGDADLEVFKVSSMAHGLVPFLHFSWRIVG